MKTERLYYTDSWLRSFDARVLRAEPVGEKVHVLLDRTAFYPASGGQPCDTGTLGAARGSRNSGRERKRLRPACGCPSRWAIS